MRKVLKYINTSYTEMTQRVSWPSLGQLRADAANVLIASLLFSLIVAGVDMVFKNMMQLIYKSF